MKKLLILIIAVIALTLPATLLACNDDDSTTTANKTVPTFEIIDPVSFKRSVEFEIKETDPDGVGEIKSIELYCNGAFVKAAENTSVRRFENLNSNTNYRIKVTYAYDLQNGEGEKNESVSEYISTAGDGFSSKTSIKREWEGKTLNIACSTWSGSAGAPWSVIELCVKEGEESGFGTKIDAAVLERQKFIKETYGIDLNWINATRYGMHNVLEEAIASGNIYYDIALPRAMRAQSIVANGSVYDLANRDYIDFSNSYYDKNSVDAFTAKGHTFFVVGSFSTLEKETAYVLFFNKNLLGGNRATNNLYQMVREGKWVWEELVALATAVYKDDGDGNVNEADTFGLYFGDYGYLYRFFGLKQATVNKETGEWAIGMEKPSPTSRVNKMSDAFIEMYNSIWYRSYWPSHCYGPTVKDGFANDQVLFYVNIIKTDNIISYENVGIAPFPMLDSEQGRYCVPVADSMYVLACIPKNTQDRRMAEYFLDVLSWTGSEYTMEAYIEQKADIFYTDVEIEMMIEYIFPNITYDPGSAVGWSALLGSFFGEINKPKNENNYSQIYEERIPSALVTIKNWNTAWGAYTES